MHDDGFDGIVIGEPAKLVHNVIRIEDHTLEVHHANFVSEGMHPGLPPAGVQRNVHQSKDGEHKEEECPSSDKDPQPNARASVFSHSDCSSLAPSRLVTETGAPTANWLAPFSCEAAKYCSPGRKP